MFHTSSVVPSTKVDHINHQVAALDAPILDTKPFVGRRRLLVVAQQGQVDGPNLV